MFVSHWEETRRQFEEFRPDVVIGFTSAFNNYIASREAKRRHIPFLYFWTDVIHSLVTNRFIRSLVRITEGLTLRRSTHVAAICEALRDYLVLQGVAPDRISIISTGVDLSRFSPSIDGGGERVALGLSSEDIVVLYLGWVYPFSGLDRVLRALAVSAPLPSPMKILIVGGGEYYGEVVAAAESLRLENIVRFEHWKSYNETPRVIAAADLCFLPAENNETMRHIVPIKIYEFLAMGKPVVATRTEGLAKEFRGCEGVVLVDTPEQVMPKSVEILSDSRMRYFLKEACLRAASNHDWGEITNSFEVLLTRLSGGDR